ncbi:hypothetical protein PZH42_29105, partial [Bacteroides cellulosilyticus]|nr:hypothetical protein [Bacteroides cellulosilyticus]
NTLRLAQSIIIYATSLKLSNGIDFFASVCDWAGAKMPEGAAGKSFRKVVEEGNPQALHQEYIITETRFDGSKTRGWVVPLWKLAPQNTIYF